METNSSPPRPSLDPAIEVLPGTDLAAVWDRFEIFEALHHSLRICNPMRSDELDAVLDVVDLSDENTVLDLACGYGELLLRGAQRAQIRGIGIDLSPWMLRTARSRASAEAPLADLRWLVGEARDFWLGAAPDVAVCIGAEWVWHDFAGTARALAERVVAGGLVVIGAARLHHAADQSTVAQERGYVETIDDMALALQHHGLEPLGRIDPDDAGWDAYLAHTADAAEAWAGLHPGERSERWIEEQADWQCARERDRDVIGWSLWVAQKGMAGA